jgi:hypothetical protein
MSRGIVEYDMVQASSASMVVASTTFGGLHQVSLGRQGSLEPKAVVPSTLPDWQAPRRAIPEAIWIKTHNLHVTN